MTAERVDARIQDVERHVDGLASRLGNLAANLSELPESPSKPSAIDEWRIEGDRG